MCEPTTIAIGIAVGAATGAAGAAIQGQDVGRGALFGAVLGGATAGVGVGFGEAGSVIGGVGRSTVGFLSPTAAFNLSSSVATGIGGGLIGSSIGGVVQMLSPGTPEYANAYQQQYQPNSQPLTVTGSGGKQAAFSLAESVRRAKKRRLTQEDVADLSIDTSSFASEGLQFA